MGRIILFTLAIASLGWSQTMLESAGITAATTTGSVAGKQVSNGITNILNKTAKQLEIGRASCRERV